MFVRTLFSNFAVIPQTKMQGDDGAGFYRFPAWDRMKSNDVNTGPRHPLL
jgi:hypothetical protein